MQAPAPSPAPAVIHAEVTFSRVSDAQAALNNLSDLSVVPANFDEDIESACVASRELAKQDCRLKRCVKKGFDENGELCDAQTFPWYSLKHNKLGEFGCGVAVELLLRFQWECCGALLLMFLLTIPASWSNWTRNQVRNSCRAFLSSVVVGLPALHNTSSSFVINASASADAPAECGYSSLPVRMPPPRRSFYLDATLGACEEFSNSTSLILPEFSSPYPYVRTPAAAYCLRVEAGAGAAVWSSCVALLLFLGFLVYLRRMQTKIVRGFDGRVWSAADYAVILEVRPPPPAALSLFWPSNRCSLFWPSSPS